jgi:Protein of unknown function (DUF2911)
MISRILFLVLLASSAPSFAQLAISPRPSPLAIVNARYKDSYLKITYSRPHKRGRVIFGGVVPYGEVWRLGADEATELTMTKDIVVSGTTLKAGTYSLFAIPDKDHWTIIINSDVGQWGAYTYNIKLDVIRLRVPVTSLTDVVYEPFTIFIDQKNEKADIVLYWDKIKVSFPIQFTEPRNP